MPTPGSQIKERLDSLESNLKAENPVLVSVVQSFKALDQVAYGMGLLGREESYATQIPWWPMISVMGNSTALRTLSISANAPGKSPARIECA